MYIYHYLQFRIITFIIGVNPVGIGFGAISSPANSVRKHRNSDVIGAFASLSSLTQVGEPLVIKHG